MPRSGSASERGRAARPATAAPKVEVRGPAFRVVGTLVQQSTNGGRSWHAVLTSGASGGARPNGSARCHPARYRAVTALAVNRLLPGTLFVATSGDLSRGPRAGSDSACAAATGGLYVLRPDGRGGLRRTDSLAAGLPFAQGTPGKTPRAYALLDLTTDPGNPDILYADAAPSHAGAGVPSSPPAGLYRSTNGGLYWSPAMGALPRLHGAVPRGQLFFDPAHTATMFDVIGGTLYRSVNRGGYWSAVTGITPTARLRLYINPVNPALMYALTSLGIFHSRDTGVTWTLLKVKGLPTPDRIRSLGFDSRVPSSFYVTPLHGLSIRVDETNPPRPPRFDVALALSPLAYDRVVLALHAAPRNRARLAVVRGAAPTTTWVTTDKEGFGYATLRLRDVTATAALRVQVRLPGLLTTVTPWLQPGWTPLDQPPITATATLTATTTTTSTATFTPTATATDTPIPIPTAYPSSPLTATWTWKQLSGTGTLPLCPLPPATATAQPTTPAPAAPAASATAAVFGTATPTPPLPSATSPVAPSPTIIILNQPTRQPTASGQIMPHDGVGSSTPTASATASGTPTASATASSPAITGTATWTATGTATAPGAGQPTAPPGAGQSTGTPSVGQTTATPTDTATAFGPCDDGPPRPRQDFVATWDNATHSLYVFGGTDARTAATYNDLSAYSTITNAWTFLYPQGRLPSPRYGAASVWDPALNMILVFGGMIGAGPFARFSNDLWGYSPDSNAWIDLSPNNAPGAPSARAHAAAAWDPANNRLLIFGGQLNDSPSPALTNDLWAYTFSGAGGAWTQLSANSASQSLPPPRQWANMAWDVPAGVLRLFGGKNSGSGSMSDTWTWSPLSGWQFEDVADQPAGRQAAGYYWDDTHDALVVGPGLSMSGNSTDVWAYEPSIHDWINVPILSAPTPAPRQMTRMIWDSADNQALLFGGRQAGVGVSNDLWALVPTGRFGPLGGPPGENPVNKGADLGQTVSRSGDRVLLTAAKVARLAASGAHYARVSFYIGDGRQTWTAARLHAYEQVVSLLAQKNIGILAVASSGITGGWTAASWTQNAQETSGGNGDNPAIEDYVNQFQMLVAHFYPAPYSVRRWEVWNEPNVPLSGCIFITVACLQQPSLEPSNFAALLARAFTAVKSNTAISDAQIVSGGVFGHSIGGVYNPSAAGATYIFNTYDEGINRTALWLGVKSRFGSYPVDLIGQHIYVDQSQRTTPVVIRTYLNWFHDAYAAFEGTGKGTLVSEVGWRTGDTNEPQVTQDIQAQNLDTAFETSRRIGFVKEICWFEFQDDPGFVHNTSWGLMDRNGVPKLAYAHFQSQ